MSRVLWHSTPGRAHPLGSLRSVVREPLPKLWLAVHFDPRDVWVGVFGEAPDVCWKHAADLYVCVVPMLPLVLKLRWNGRRAALRDARRAWQEWRQA